MKAAAIHSILAEKPFTFDQLDEYLEVIKWKLGPQELESLQLFYHLAHEMNLIDHEPLLSLAKVYR